jgi:hypothetical protein
MKGNRVFLRLPAVPPVYGLAASASLTLGGSERR